MEIDLTYQWHVDPLIDVDAERSLRTILSALDAEILKRETEIAEIMKDESIEYDYRLFLSYEMRVDVDEFVGIGLAACANAIRRACIVIKSAQKPFAAKNYQSPTLSSDWIRDWDIGDWKSPKFNDEISVINMIYEMGNFWRHRGKSNLKKRENTEKAVKATGPGS